MKKILYEILTWSALAVRATQTFITSMKQLLAALERNLKSGHCSPLAFSLVCNSMFLWFFILFLLCGHFFFKISFTKVGWAHLVKGNRDQMCVDCKV